MQVLISTALFHGASLYLFVCRMCSTVAQMVSSLNHFVFHPISLTNILSSCHVNCMKCTLL